jgi:hypothetical protein
LSVESLGFCNVLLHHCHSQTHIDGRYTTTRDACFMAHGRAGSRTTAGCSACAVAARSVHAWSGESSTPHPMLGFRVYTLGKALLRCIVTTLQCILIRRTERPAVWQTQTAKCKCMLKIGLPPTALPPTPMILCSGAQVTPPLSDIPHPASLLPPLCYANSERLHRRPNVAMSERHEPAVISPHPNSRLAACSEYSCDSPFSRLCGRRASGRERRLLLRMDVHGAYAGITPGHTDHSQRGVWLAVGYAHVFCILQR